MTWHLGIEGRFPASEGGFLEQPPTALALGVDIEGGASELEAVAGGAIFA